MKIPKSKLKKLLKFKKNAYLPYPTSEGVCYWNHNLPLLKSDLIFFCI
jgi:hypothetical protein